MFSARIKWEGDPTTWAIVEWQAAPDSGLAISRPPCTFPKSDWCNG